MYTVINALTHQHQYINVYCNKRIITIFQIHFMVFSNTTKYGVWIKYPNTIQRRTMQRQTLYNGVQCNVAFTLAERALLACKGLHMFHPRVFLKCNKGLSHTFYFDAVIFYFDAATARIPA